MTVDVGQTLDKYQLLEKVGQGGMAVVYRGLDTSLRREVAVKVLHRHLAEHQEARDRFEREAHAVAKLRHENILEIFDFSGNASDESYIVTEFIDGVTLKEFVTRHPIQHPEVGAMIALQVCRALVHAHSLGVLHRDVKPENIMIRSDGVVKLTDFGIAQMLDLQRMTVTGQLLGSPAYMSPEHVEGGQLDFRTDVFAVGIVLYQLICGELPFRGKNPHEILKRIAECQYRDPQQVSPLVGSELARIVSRSLARDPDDRYADISLMLEALEGFVAGSGLGDAKSELARFFDAPVSYELALRARLLDHLAKRGRELFEDDRIRALELFNRVLTLEPEHPEVLALLDRVGRRQRVVRAAALIVGLALLGGGAAAAVALRGGDEPPLPAAVPLAVADAPDDEAAIAAPSEAEPEPTAAVGDASPLAEPPADAASAPATSPARRPERGPRRAVATPVGAADAAVPVASSRRVPLVLTPRGSEYRVGDGPWITVGSARTTAELPVGTAVVRARNEACCQEEQRVVDAAEPGPVHINLRFLPGTVVPRCDRPGARVNVDGKPARLDQPATIIIERLTGTELVSVEFFADDRVDQRTIPVRARERREVPCEL